MAVTARQKWSEGKTSNRQGWLRHGFPSLGPTHLRSEVFYFIYYFFFVLYIEASKKSLEDHFSLKFIGTGLGIHALHRGKG